MKWDPKVVHVDGLQHGGVIPHTDLTKDGILFTVQVPEGETASLLLYEKGKSDVKSEIPFPLEPLAGRIHAMTICGVCPKDLEYNYRIGDRVVTDPFARLLTGNGPFGDASPRGDHQVRGAFACAGFDWGADEKRLQIPYSESVFYELHVRGFTQSPTSGIRSRGTFAGITEKIPYLKSLGITAVMLMPCYEFDEVPRRRRLHEGGKALAHPENGPFPEEEGAPVSFEGASSLEGGMRAPHERINYWGYGPGWYFAPKRSYSAGEDPSVEFRTMVRELHAAGIEVLMEMNFPAGTDPAFMHACLVWWTLFYHVDGFLLMGQAEDVSAVAKSAALKGVKLIADYFDTSRMYPEGRTEKERTLAEYNAGFRNDARRFLKGDTDSLQSFVSRSRYNPHDAGVINAVTGHDGFTLYDLVSYNDKHNEENGEHNRDGAPCEFSWNCGTEGPTRKRGISRLRMKQMKNALALMMLAQGTPMLTAGDEMLNTQKGNSNPYCLDSEVSWVRWSSTKDAQELSEYVRMLIAFRAAHPLLHQQAELTGSSQGGFFPDFSCHGSNAWFASFDQQERSVGMMYCSQMPDADVLKEPDRGSYLYAAYNFHWEEKELALPYLPAGREWHLMIDTSVDRYSMTDKGTTEESPGTQEVKTVRVSARSVRVLVG